jgi:squalene synthase HpnC
MQPRVGKNSKTRKRALFSRQPLPVKLGGVNNALSAQQSVGHYENFPVASILCPARIRPAIKAIYAFARIADDIADEGDASASQRLHALAAYSASLEATLHGKPPTQAPWPALADAITQFSLPVEPLRDLLSAFIQDVTTTRYASFEALLDYCRRSASPIGRLLLHLYGVTDMKSREQSDAICTALQLINFWQDVGVDARKNPPQGRIYLPMDTLAEYEVGEMQVLRGRVDDNFCDAIEFECQRARALMRAGAPLAARLPGRTGWELRLVVQGGLRILEKIAAQGFNTLTQRPKLNNFDYALMLLRAIKNKVNY